MKRCHSGSRSGATPAAAASPSAAAAAGPASALAAAGVGPGPAGLQPAAVDVQPALAGPAGEQQLVGSQPEAVGSVAAAAGHSHELGAARLAAHLPVGRARQGGALGPGMRCRRRRASLASGRRRAQRRAAVLGSVRRQVALAAKGCTGTSRALTHHEIGAFEPSHELQTAAAPAAGAGAASAAAAAAAAAVLLSKRDNRQLLRSLHASPQQQLLLQLPATFWSSSSRLRAWVQKLPGS